ncbi:xylose ABC transporter ATP-binding protein [Spirochaeta africana]|uniref:ABC-type sugar transport system, ATPase component n=1 Tax=Spirochaeta africana (strain ATCC 700263 / DSM 8902 / Z-7692) TaxID=889378 RepID=H9UFU0_SPIAZ|nr:xylose ABC transporter ATP-binding protein [Spirochaeta africana]AFG36383.1 ABC-type sugar transport system, ATPase component [Spirochaeta africana DSM 8902]
MSDYILEMKNIVKEFPGVRALDDVSFAVKPGEIHALVGENGAGKSTLMKVLSGVHPYGSYEGDIVVNGEHQRFQNIKDSEIAGISIIYQELALVPQMTVAENLFLGAEKGKSYRIDWDYATREATKYLQEVNLQVSPETLIKNLGIGKQQLVEIAKAVAKKARILILDEPTAALNEHDSENLLEILRQLRERGVTCVYISHKLEEVMAIADTITVLRDGKTVATHDQHGSDPLDEARIVSLMVGRELTERFPRIEHTPGETVMQIRNWTVQDPGNPEKNVVEDVSFDIRKGEILGVAGLMGAGRTELMMSIFGAYGKRLSGEMFMNGKKIEINNPLDAIQAGVAYVTEDRKGMGLVLGMDIRQNTSLAALRDLAKLSVINRYEEIKQTNHYVKSLRIKTPSIEQKAKNLSGGNQQKVVLGKWMLTRPSVLILDEPTRGIDVGAKFEIYNIMNALVDQGVCIVMISSELPEVLGMSDRVIVIHKGRLNGDLHWKDATQEKTMLLATGGK